MFHSLENAICEIKGPDRRIAARRPVSGGDINDASLLTLDDGEEIFMKANVVAMLPAFKAEEQGLLAISQTGTIGTAEVLGIGTDPDGFSFLLQAPIHSGHRIREYWETLGEELRAMHAAPVQEDFRHCFGFPADNFIGAGKQINVRHSSWIDFYRECRLTPQLRTAEKYLNK